MKYLKPILLSILILAVTYSSSIYIIRLGQEKFMKDFSDLPSGLYAVIPIDIWYMVFSMVILTLGCFLLCIILRCFKGGEVIEEC